MICWPRLPEPIKAVVIRLLGAVPNWPQAEGRIKLSAAWMIQACGLKGLREGGARVSEQHALVLVRLADSPSAGEAAADRVAAGKGAELLLGGQLGGGEGGAHRAQEQGEDQGCEAFLHDRVRRIQWWEDLAQASAVVVSLASQICSSPSDEAYG